MASSDSRDTSHATNGDAPLKSQEKRKLVGSKDEPSDDDSQKKGKKKQDVSGFFQLFRFADKLDVLMTVAGVFFSLVTGATTTGSLIIFGDLLQSFTDSGYMKNMLETIPEFLEAKNLSSLDAFKDVDKVFSYCSEMYNYTNGSFDCSQFDVDDDITAEMGGYAIIFLGIALMIFLSASLQILLLSGTAHRQITRLRQTCFRNLLRQEIAWFDKNNAGVLAVIMTEDVSQIHAALSDHLHQTVQYHAAFIAGMVVSFISGWELSLAMLSIVPLISIASSLMAVATNYFNIREREAYGKAGTIADEVFSSVRTVFAFNGQEKEEKRYTESLTDAKVCGIKKGAIGGLGRGIQYFCLYAGYSICFYYGGKLTRHGDYSVQDMLTILYAIFVGASSLGFGVPALEGVMMGRVSAFKVYQLVDRKSQLDPCSSTGLKPLSVSGSVELQNVHFTYPTRPGVKILRGVDLKISKGATVALVGPSGCGKSTVVQLLLRFYDPQLGKIYIDGHDVKDINVKWLRQQVGLVSQEPVLFATTIAQNIRYGSEDATMDQIIEASKTANAYNFIMKLPKQFETLVGERGAQLSGGQKQRIAIARALVRDPSILLLDEATSALDTESEAVVQEALDKASKDRTTLVVAHRLSTIRHADTIVAFSEGRVVEMGTHDELIAKNGIYAQLVTSQAVDDTSQKSTCSEEEMPQQRKLAEFKRSRSISTEKSFDDTAIDDFDEQSTDKTPDTTLVWRLFKLNSPEWHIILLGCVCALINGAYEPIYGILFGELMKILSDEDLDYQRDRTHKLALFTLGLAVLNFLTRSGQEASFAVSGEYLTLRTRSILFRAMIKHDIGWFDDPRHSTGSLTGRLATEASLIKMGTGSSLGLLIQCIANLCLSMAFGMYYSWQLILVQLLLYPFILFSGYMNIRGIRGFSKKYSASQVEATDSAIQCIANIRTVAALTKEMEFYHRYEEAMNSSTVNIRRLFIVNSICYGIAQCTMYLNFAVTFYVGSMLIESGDIEFYDALRLFCIVTLSAALLGRTIGLTPDLEKARDAAVKIFKMADDETDCSTSSGPGLKLCQENFKSTIRFANVKFHYPMRSERQVLNGANLSVEPGMTLALVGESGCGKSTTVQLIERFYDPQGGKVILDKHNLKDLDVHWLRSLIGLVSQEPVLFDRSISENIAYGDNSREVSMNEIVRSARAANIHNFIESLPNGYETNVGSKGTQLSGGQKQRVAIARALVRNPKILLLDEATSALDTESEKIVQDALDKARKGRTCIIIAHRLSTIRNADKIAVFKDGAVQECGTHSQLMAQRGLYYQLHTVQHEKPHAH